MTLAESEESPLVRAFRKLAAGEPQPGLGVCLERELWSPGNGQECTLRVKRLGSGEARSDVPVVVAVGPLAGRTGEAAYRRVAAHLRNADLWVIEPPGFRKGEKVPADTDALLAAHEEAFDRIPRDRGVLLLGHSSGGWLAHELTAHLTARGAIVNGLVVADAYMAGSPQFGECLRHLAGAMIKAPSLLSSPGADEWISAMHHYITMMFGTWEPTPLDVPTLLLRAAEPFTAWETLDDWKVRWSLPHVSAEVPGNHFTMLHKGAPDCARLIDDWAERLVPV